MLLDTWGVPYEYPFYQVCNIARGADVSLRGAPIHTGSDMKEHLLSIPSKGAQYEYDYLKEQKLFDDEYTCVRARQQVNGIPFVICDIISPNYRPENPQFDEGVFVLWQFNSRGEIVFAEASNLHEVVAESEALQPILGWQECLASLSKNNRFFDGLLEAKVVGAELCYAINGKHITYPVWQFLVEFSQVGFNQEADSALQQYLCFAVYVDACSGLPL